MIDIIIHIESDYAYMDSDVSIKIKLPALPGEGSILNLTEEMSEELTTQARKSLKIGRRYFDWFYGESINISINKLKKENLKDLDFVDACIVDDIVFYADESFVRISLKR